MPPFLPPAAAPLWTALTGFGWRDWATFAGLVGLATLLGFMAYWDLGSREPGQRWSAVRSWFSDWGE